ncbi:MAG: hypothetical protein AAFO95_19600 [Cyanobacteria bacterium J06600_6]
MLYGSDSKSHRKSPGRRKNLVEPSLLILDSRLRSRVIKQKDSFKIDIDEKICSSRILFHLAKIHNKLLLKSLGIFWQIWIFYEPKKTLIDNINSALGK